jgi:putative transposase
MSSPPALVYENYYHIFNRGNNRENIFIQERNYEYFLNLFFKYIDPIAETFAYCLMRNHFHLAVRIRSEQEIMASGKTLKVSIASDQVGQQSALASNPSTMQEKPLGSTSPSRQFSNFFNAYAKAINRAYGRMGSLFQHPFGRVQITTGRQFWYVIAYIHQNPQKHKFVNDFRDWKWSSYGILLSEMPTRLSRDAVLDWFGGIQNYKELHSDWVQEARSRWFAEDDPD